MSRKNFCVSLDPSEVEIIQKEMKLSLSKFIQHSIETLLSEGFDDYVLIMKGKMISDDIQNAKEEQLYCRDRIVTLDDEIKRLEDMYEENKKSVEFAQTVGRLAALTQELNHLLIVNEFKVDNIRDAKIIEEIKKLNPAFDVDRHNSNLLRIMGY